MAITYTVQDKINAHLFADANYKIRLLNAMHMKRPNIISKLKINLRDATQDDYYIPRALMGHAKIFNVTMTESCCKALSCNPMRETTPCTVNDQASWYYVGDSEFDVQCQPACFNTATTQVYDSTNTRTPDTPLLNWNDNTCRIVNSSIASWEEKPFYRSDTKFEKRLNDLPTGFTRIKSDNRFGCGYTYKNNPTYCSYYDLTYDAKNETCETSIFEKIIGAVVGSSLLQNLKGGIKTLVNGGDALAIPSNLPKKPTSIPITLDAWQHDIDKTFKIPDLIDYTSTKKSRRRRRNVQIDHPRQLLEDAVHKRQFKNQNSTTNVPLNDSTPPDITTAKKIWESIFEFITDPEAIASIGIDLSSSYALKKLKTLLIKLTEKMSAGLAKTLTRIPGSFGIRVIETAIQNVALKVVAGAALRIGAQVAIFLARLLAAAASVVGWLLMAAFVFDLIFAFWDPLGYNNIFSSTLPNDTMYNGELGLRQALGTPTADYEWEQLIKLILTEDEIFSISLESILDQLIYLDALVVNSEGSVIDKGQDVSFTGSDSTQLQEGSNVARAKRLHFSLVKFRDYNAAFYKRAKLSQILHTIGYSLVAVGGTLLLIQLKLLAFVCLILAITILAFVKLLVINNDAIVNFAYNSPINITSIKDGDTNTLL